MLTFCRYLGLVYAIGLAIGEAAIHITNGYWQYAPLWVIDYVIVAYLLVGFWATRRRRNVPVLMSAYALSAGVLYIAFFLNFDPELHESNRGSGVLIWLMGLVLGVSVVGLIGTTTVWFRSERAGPTSSPPPA